MTLPATTRTTLIGFIALCFATILATAVPATAGDPDLTHRTIKTEHFNIHYHNGLEHTARLTASIAEEVFEEITILFRWKVKKRINVVITDSTDSANGSASVYGRPVIRLYATAPTLDSTLSSHDHWLRTLFVHEFTHIVHLSIHGKTSDIINSVFGDIYNPNQLLPRSIIEGIAVLIETHATTAGRIRSSHYNMYIRTAALEDTLLDLGQVSNTTRRYLRGSHSYIYGAMFMEYIYQKFGMEKIIEFGHLYGASVLPYGINRAFLDIFGQDIVSLYREWVADTIRRAEATRDALSEEGLTESVALSSDGESKGRPIFDIDDRSVLLPMSNGMVDSGVYRIPLDGTSKPEPLFLAGSHTHLSMDRNGRIFYNRTAPYKNAYRFHDLFVADRTSPVPRRLTVGRRIRYGAVSGRGDQVAVSTNGGGTSHLQLTDDRGNFIRDLLVSNVDDQVYDPVWSPDGTHIAAIVRKKAKVDLALIEVETGAIRFLTQDRSLETSPAFDPTGRYLLFGSDRTGIPNIYAYDLQTDRILKITNVLTGAFFPAVSHNGKMLAFLKYRSEGYDLHIMPLDLAGAPLAPPSEERFEEAPDMPAPSDLPSEKYNPLPVMRPSHWRLNTSFDVDWNATFQASTGFSDLSGRHNAGAELTYVTENQNVSGRIAYSYNGLPAGIRLGVSRQYSPMDDGYVLEGQPKDWTLVVTRGSLGLGFSVPGVDSNHGLSVSYYVVHSRPREDMKLTIDPRGELPEVPESYFRAGLSFGWSYGSTLSSPLGIGAHKGRSMGASVDLNHPSIGGTQTLATFRYHWTEYFRVPWPWIDHHIMSVGVNGGVHVSDPPNHWSFSVGGGNSQNIVDTILNNKSAGAGNLRGYPAGAFRGSHFHSLKLAYRFPIWFAEWGYGTVPIYLRRVQGAVFSDNAIISYDELDRDDWKSSVGAEVSIPFAVGYYQGMSMRFGYARGLMDGGENVFIFLLSGGG